MIVGDLNADPQVISSLSKGMTDGAWMDVERAFALGRGVTPPPTCKFQLDEGKGTRRDFALACPIALAAITSCSVRPGRWFPLHFGILTEVPISACGASVTLAKVHSLIWPACWVHCTDRSRRSSSEEMQNVWDAHILEIIFDPMNVRERLRAACDTCDVDASWQTWTKEAEASLTRAYHTAARSSHRWAWFLGRCRSAIIAYQEAVR